MAQRRIVPLPTALRFAGHVWQAYDYAYLSPNQVMYYIRRWDTNLSRWIKRIVLATEIEPLSYD